MNAAHKGRRAEHRARALLEAAGFANGQRLTEADKKHAILLAFKAWPDKSTTTLAEQIGVNQGYVSELRRKVKDTLNLPSRVTGGQYLSRRAVDATPQKPLPYWEGFRFSSSLVAWRPHDGT